MYPDPRRSNAHQKFQDEYRELFGDAPETIGDHSSDINTESAFNFGKDWQFASRPTEDHNLNMNYYLGKSNTSCY